MDKHGIGTDASIPQHMKNICDRHYVDICGPGEDGQRGQIIQGGGYILATTTPFLLGRGVVYQKMAENLICADVVKVFKNREE